MNTLAYLHTGDLGHFNHWLDVDPLVSAETTRGEEPHIAVDADLGLLGVGLLVESLVLQTAVAQLTVITPVRFQPLKSSLGLSPSAPGLILLGGSTTRGRGPLEWGTGY